MNTTSTVKEKFSGRNLDRDRVPRHIAFIMDGNGRWAESQGLQRIHGHMRGYVTATEIIEACGEIGVEAVTLYTFSVENWKRPAEEVDGIMRLISEAAHQQMERLVEKGVRLVLSGRIDELPEFVRASLMKDVEATKDENKLTLNLAVNYGGRAEIVDACRRIAQKAAEGKLKPEDVDDDCIRQHLYQPGLPEPDLIVRTAGELRISNFLIWQSAYSEIHVTQTLWPDFKDDDLLAAVEDYQGRVRKFGQTALQVNK